MRDEGQLPWPARETQNRETGVGGTRGCGHVFGECVAFCVFAYLGSNVIWCGER